MKKNRKAFTSNKRAKNRGRHSHHHLQYGLHVIKWGSITGRFDNPDS